PGLYTPVFGPPAERYVSFSPDGRKLLVLSYDRISVWDSTTGALICTLKPEKETTKPDFLVSTQFSPDGKLVLTEQCNGVTRVWTAVTGRQIRAFDAAPSSEQYWPYALFTPDGRRVISGSADGLAILWEIQSGKEIRRFRIPEGTGVVDYMIISC